MVETVRGRRESRKGPLKSYRIEEAFPTLDSEDESTAQVSDPESEEARESEEDVFMPEENDEDPDDEMIEEVDEEEDLHDNDPRLGTPTEDEVRRSKKIITVDCSDEEIENGSKTPEETGIGTKQKQKQKRRVGSNVHILAAGFKTKTQHTQHPIVPATKAHAKGLEKVHARGVEHFGRGGGLEIRLKDLFGPTGKDLMPILQTRDYWDCQETLPSRADGSLRRSFHIPEGAREREIENLREWYAGVGKTEFEEGQRTTILGREAGDMYMSNPGPPSINVTIGQFNDPLLYKMKKGSYLSTATPFIAKENRRGWIFNLGSKIQDAQWALNEEGSTQYLAVAVEQRMTSGPGHKPMENPQAPAFSATERFPASIQIWAFDATAGDDLNPERSPRLELVICTDWGAPKSFRWCPIAVTESPDEGDKTHLGLLAGFWSDGKVRILDVSYPKPVDSAFQTQYIHFSCAAFDVKIPQTIPSCIHWLSATSLAVTTASGALAIWTISHPKSFRPSGMANHNRRPWFFKQVADTYILSLTSGYPSRPSYISYTTADGYAKLIDLRSPLLDTCSANRGRSLTLAQAWHEQTQAFIMSDDYYLLRSNTLRRYYTNIYSMRSESSILCCATSPVQPAVLIGSVDGTVQAGNPIARLMNDKEIPWQQTWFKHEWRPSVYKLTLKTVDGDKDAGEGEYNEMEEGEEGAEIPNKPQTSQDPTSGTEASNIPQTSTGLPSGPGQPRRIPKVLPEVLSQPLARITEGYKVQRVNMAFPKPYDAYHIAGGKYVTIFEELSAVTVVAWNPNLRFGTWAVAGMADGLLRVEDLDV